MEESKGLENIRSQIKVTMKGVSRIICLVGRVLLCFQMEIIMMGSGDKVWWKGMECSNGMMGVNMKDNTKTI